MLLATAAGLLCKLHMRLVVLPPLQGCQASVRTSSETCMFVAMPPPLQLWQRGEGAGGCSHESWCARRLEAYKPNGRRLNGVDVKECKHGPHEMRGLVRNDLLATLAAALPEGAIRTSSSVTGVSRFEEGAGRGSAKVRQVCWFFWRPVVNQGRQCCCMVCSHVELSGPGC